jgi:hypothetical protein
MHNILQKQALQWAMDREYPELPRNEKDKPVQFWQLRKAGGQVSRVLDLPWIATYVVSILELLF